MTSAEYKVCPQTLDNTIQQIIDSITRGEDLQNIDQLEVSDKDKLKYNDCIILKPEYQREYRASQEDESSLIESVLVGIPIPQVFLVSSKFKGVQVLDVVDGQHRLKAFFRYRNGEFRLKGLKILKKLEGKKFNDLDFIDQQNLISYKLSAFIFRDFPGKEFELEIFSRYNKGTKTLTPQEIRNAVYTSPINDWISDFVKKIFYAKDIDSRDGKLKQAYNVTQDRFLKKKIHESIFTLLYILEKGIDTAFKDSTTYSEEYMKEKADSFDKYTSAETDVELRKITEQFKQFNDWIIFIMKEIKYPFSKELYGISSRNYKFQMSIAMLLAAVFNGINNKEELFNESFMNNLSISLENSYLENPDCNVSTTNSNKINDFVNDFLKLKNVQNLRNS